MRGKRVAYGWIEDQSHFRDYDTDEILGRRCKDETLKAFSFGLEGTIGCGRVVLHLPLIAKKKEFWTRCRYSTRKVKVTIEFV